MPSTNKRIEQYGVSCAEREVFEKNKQPFMFPGFGANGDFYLANGLTLIGAKTGQSKSTTAAHLLACFIKHVPEGTALVISNEELVDAVIHRTACVLLKKSYIAFHRRKLSAREDAEIRDLSLRVLERVVVVNDPAWDTTCLEDVLAIIESCVTQEVRLILIDYLQTVTYSKDNPDLDTYQVSKKLGEFFLAYGKKSHIPIVTMCQLRPSGGANIEFQDRVQGDKTIANHAPNIVEIRPDFEKHITEFIIHKDRFGPNTGKKTSLIFNNGVYEYETQVGF